LGLPVRRVGLEQVMDRRAEAYVGSLVSFASPCLERPELLKPLVSSGRYKTTESEILMSLPASRTSLTRGRGLSLVREACRPLTRQVATLRRRWDKTLPGDRREGRATNVVAIRTSSTAGAEGARCVDADDEHVSARLPRQGGIA
jgi:hypothetical protein